MHAEERVAGRGPCVHSGLGALGGLLDSDICASVKRGIISTEEGSLWILQGLLAKLPGLASLRKDGL